MRKGEEAGEQVAFFLPQLVQLLRGDSNGQIREYMLTAARQSVLYSHILICCLKVRPTPAASAGVLITFTSACCISQTFQRQD